MRRLVQILVPSLLLVGCFGPGEGLEVPDDEIYFPVGLSIDSAGEHLFVVSSDFDLQYNGGAIQSYALSEVARELPETCASDQDCERTGGTCVNGLCEVEGSPCGELGEHRASELVLYPTRCRPLDQSRGGVQVDQVKIGAFATDIVRRSWPDGAQDRLFIPVRGDTTLHWIDVQGGTFSCGQTNNDGACDDRHRAGDEPTENSRGLSLASEPFAIDANEDGSTIVVSNQTSGTASLFTNDWSTGPELRFALSSDRIPSRPIGVANLPLPRALSDAPPADGAPDAFLLSFRNSAQVRLIRFAGDQESEPARPYLVDAGGVGIEANSVGSDSRGLAVDSFARKRAEQRCGDDAACLAQAALVPLDVYVANRSPASLLIGRTRPPQEYPYFFESLPLTIGPSRVVVGRVLTPDGEEETRVFVVCFDSRRVFIYDPQRSRFEAELWTGRGPHAVAVDTERRLLYVGHFTDSFIGVFSLDLSHPASYGTMVGMLGKPKSPRSSK